MKNERGIALLESAVMFVFLVTLFGMGLCAGHYVYETNRVDKALDKHVFDSGFIPFEMRYKSNGEIDPVLRKVQLEAFIQQVVQNIEDELFGLQLAENTALNFKVEAKYFEVSIDPATGEVDTSYTDSLVPISSQHSTAVNDSGSNVLKGQVEGILSLTTSYDYNNNGVVEESEAFFSYANPSVHFTTEGRTDRFFPKTVIIGVTVARDVRQEGWVSMANGLFSNSVIERTKTIVLRGDASL